MLKGTHILSANKKYILWIGMAFFYTSTSRAALVENLTLGNAKALSLGNAVTADPPDIDSIHFNPAGLTRLSGRQLYMKLIAGSFDMNVEFGKHAPQVDAFFEDNYSIGAVPPGTFDDVVVNSTSESSGAALILPGTGVVTMPFIVVPTGGASYSPPGSHFTFATNVYSPMAAGYTRDGDDSGRFLGREIALSRLTYFSPSMAVQMTDNLSVGASVGLSYQGVGVGLDLRVPNIGLAFAEALSKSVCTSDTPVVDICGGHVGPYTEVASLNLEADEPLSLTYNVGFLWSPLPWLSFGAVYQSGATDTLKGEYQIQYDQNWSNLFQQLRKDPNGAALVALAKAAGVALPYGQTIERGHVEVSFPTPEHIAFGSSVQLLPDWKINLDVKRSAWAAWQDLEITFDQDIDFLRLAHIVQPEQADLSVLRMPIGFQNVWNWGLGIEHAYSDQWTFRWGFEPRPSSVPEDKHTVLLPIGDGKLFSTGLSYTSGRSSELAFALGYFKAKRYSPAGSSDTSNSLDQRLFIYNPYMGTDYQSEVTAFILALNYRREF